MYIDIIRQWDGNLLRRAVWRFMLSSHSGMAPSVVLDRYSEQSRANTRIRNWVVHKQFNRFESANRCMLSSQILREPPKVPEDVRKELREKLNAMITFDFN